MRLLLTVVGFVAIVLLIPQRTFAQVARIDDKPTIVPGEYIVQYKPDHNPDQIRAKAASWSENEDQLIGQAINRLKTIQLRNQGQALPPEVLKELESIEDSLNVVQEKIIGDYYLMKSTEAISPALAAVAFRQADIIETAEPNRYVYAAAAPNDTFYPNQWSLSKMNMETAWETNKTSGKIKVAVLDSGVNYNHEDIDSSKIIKGRDYINNDNDPMDDMGHGTHVAGIIGAATNNQKGVAGVSWDAQILAVKVLNSGGTGDLTNVIESINSIADSNQANIINLSLDGEGTCPQALQNAINSAVERNITVVVAAGNEHNDSAGYFPANCQNVIAVGALGPDSERARYSNYGSLVDVAAPGGNPSVPSGSSYDCNANGTDCIISTWLSNEYALSAGTSMAAPHVAGLVALMLGVNSGLTPAQIETILKDTGTTISTDQPIGKLINAQAALLAINTGDPTPTPTGTANTPTPTPTPTSVQLPPEAPTPTRIDNVCPATCDAGDVNCNGAIHDEDYNIWRDQYDQYRGGVQLEGTARTGDLDCSLDNAASPGYVTLADFEIWRKHSFVVNPGTACGTAGTIEGESYETLSINGSPETRAISGHPDYNIALRGWEAVPNARKEIYDMGPSADPDPNTPPQLKGLFADNRIPQVSGTYQMYDWNWGAGDNIGSKGGLYSAPPEVQLLGTLVTKGEVLKVPDSGYEITSGYEVMVLYADDNSIMLSYKGEDTAATGYVLHVLDVCVEPRLLALYTASNQGGGARVRLPALKAGQAFGRSKETEVKFTIRDTGSFMEPRNTQNWWR